MLKKDYLGVRLRSKYIFPFSLYLQNTCKLYNMTPTGPHTFFRQVAVGDLPYIARCMGAGHLFAGGYG